MLPKVQLKKIIHYLRPIKMRKIRIIGFKEDLPNILKFLHEKGFIEIRRVNYENLGIMPGRAIQHFDEVSEKLVTLRNLFDKLDDMGILKKSELNSINPIETKEKVSNIPLNDLIRRVDNNRVIKNLNGYIKSIEALKSKISEKERIWKELLKIRDFDIDFSKLKAKSIDYLAAIGNVSLISKINNELKKYTEYYNVLYWKKKDKAHILILFGLPDIGLLGSKEIGDNKDKGNKEKDTNSLSELRKKIEKLVISLGCEIVQIPENITNPKEEIRKIKQEIISISGEMGNVIRKTEKTAMSNALNLLKLYYALEMYADRFEITSRFNFTKDTFVLEGWVKKDILPSVKHEIVQMFDDRIFLSEIQPKKGEEPPVALDNPEIAKPFEFITRNYSFPNIHELDPSLVFLFTIPFIYGMIVGDVGYAIISYFIAGLLMNKFKRSEIIQEIGRLWQLSSIFAAFFGIVYDEWLGISHFKIISILKAWGIPLGISSPIYTGISRVHDLPFVLLISIIVGILHLAFGFILGAIEHWHHNRKHAYGKIAWLFLEVGLVLAVLPSTTGISTSFMYVGIAIIMASIIVIGWTEGTAGVVELPGIVGNILSYARIAAVGVVGVILAEVINEFLMPLPTMGITAIIIFPLFILMHSANTLIAMFEALIQGGRLNIVEFRTKFIHGGGKPFKPFTLKEPVSKL